VIGPDRYLYVAVRTSNGLGGEVMRFDPVSGAWIDDFVKSDPTNDLNRPEGLVFGPDGNLYITSFTRDPSNSSTAVTDTEKFLDFEGKTGKYIGKIAPDKVGQPRTFPKAILFGPAGKLFVSIENTGEIREYDASPGAFTQASYTPGSYQSFFPANANGGRI